MTPRHIPALVTITAVLFAAQPGAADDDLSDIVNYRAYSPLLSSSGQPTEEQLRAVRDAGFERVVFLAFSDHDESLEHEDRIVRELGMEYAQVPVIWETPTPDDFYQFAGLLQAAPAKKTLVHCQVNFRASTFSFLYRVIFDDVPIADAKADLNTVWVPNATWRALIFEVLEDNGRSPECDDCLWE
jgi:protein tyrosine phosphatase (PTP) superfamily phosphohydrolase (DUF442 family)